MRGHPAFRRSARNPTHFAMPTMSYLWTRGIYMQCAPERELITIQALIKKRQRGCRTPLMNAGDGGSIQSATSHQSSQAAHRTADVPPDLSLARRNRREGQWSLSANGARLWYDELPTSPLWASYMRKANEVAREMCAPSTWEQRMSLAGQFTTFCRTHERTMNEESCAAFLMAIEVAPSTRLRHARMLRSMLEMNRTPLDMMIMGLQKIAARSETKQARPLTKEEMNQVIRSRTDWKERVVLRLAWITASRLFEIAALTANNLKLKPDGAINFGLVRGAEDGEGGSPPRLAVREDTRAGRLRHYKAMQYTSRKRKAHEYY
ncbi:hypothetical protein TcBrA4_0043600 [Trypanosoma cruzi]|nr:hypothetical protein TcBrA4_0043600 [Trypanosoma cruzi]